MKHILITIIAVLLNSFVCVIAETKQKVQLMNTPDGIEFGGWGSPKSEHPAPRARAIVEATTNYLDPSILAKVSRNLGEPMTGIEMDSLETRLAERGW